MTNESENIIPYRTFLLVLAGLIILTVVSVALTEIYLGALTVAAALLIAAVKSSFVLRYFMHLKSESRVLTIMLVCVILLISSVIIVTLLDYIFR